MVLLRGLLLQAGMLPDKAEEAQYNTLRRFMPSAGEALRYDTPSAQSLSNWTEVAKGENPRAAARATHPSSRHYAETKDDSSFYNKFVAVRAVEMAGSQPSDSPMDRGGSQPSADLLQNRNRGGGGGGGGGGRWWRLRRGHADVPSHVRYGDILSFLSLIQVAGNFRGRKPPASVPELGRMGCEGPSYDWGRWWMELGGFMAFIT